MRTILTETKVPRMGETRTVREFLWFPLTLDGERRWLEWANIIQEWGWWAHEDPNGWKYIAWEKEA